MVLLKPGFDAVDMEVVLALEVEDLGALQIHLEADGANVVFVFCLDRLYW
jgi:hypothetical protein